MVERLGKQQQKQFENWVLGILLAICGENEFIYNLKALV